MDPNLYVVVTQYWSSSRGRFAVFLHLPQGHPKLEEVEFKDVVCMTGTLHLVLQMILVSVHQLKALRLKGISISRTVIMALPYCLSLKQLSLVQCQLNDADAAALSLALVNHPAVEAVDLSCNDLSDIGIVAFSRVLDKNLALITLRLDGNGKVSGQQRADVEGKLLEHILAKAA